MFTKIKDRNKQAEKQAETKQPKVYEAHMRVIDGVYRDKKGLENGDKSFADCNCFMGCSNCGGK